MIIRLGSFCYLLVIIITMGSPIVMITDAYAQRPEESLDWSIQTSKNTFYPDEPILLTLKISNTGQQKKKVDFGMDGIEAFSMEIHDCSNKIVAQGGHIQRYGLSRIGTLSIPLGGTGQKSIVLNQWCSTLLPPGQYHVVCHVEYRLRSEATKIPGTEPAIFKAGPLHTIKLELDIQILEMDTPKFEQILEDLAIREVRKDGQSKGEWLRKWQIAREMITFAESDLALPYQLHILRVAPSTWLKLDVINSLIRSETLEGAIGLVQTMEYPFVYEDIKRELIDAVYRLRETGKSDIINATDEFVVKYKRPVLAKPRD